MLRKARAFLIVSALIGGIPGQADAQEAVDAKPMPHMQPPARGVPVEEKSTAAAPPTAPVQDAAGEYFPFEDRNGPLLRGDPLLDPFWLPPPGWFAAVEVDVVHPIYKNHFTAQVPIAGLPDQTVQIPGACLGWTGSPQVDVGYRLPQGFGEFSLSYRSLVSEGNGVVLAFDSTGGPGLLTSRLNLNVVDIDYGSHEIALGKNWDMKWKAGARIAANFYDTRAQGSILGQRVSSNFVGGGPHAGLELQRRLGRRGLALLGKWDGAIETGKLNQTFEETLSAAGSPFLGGALTEHDTQYVPMVRVQAGMSWTPLPGQPLRFQVGYVFEEWWGVGRLQGSDNESTADLTINGVFLRGEWRY